VHEECAQIGALFEEAQKCAVQEEIGNLIPMPDGVETLGH